MVGGSLFTRYFLDVGIRETGAYRALHDADLDAFVAAIRPRWQRLHGTAHPSEAETESLLIFPTLDALGWAHLPQQSADRRRNIADALLFLSPELEARAAILSPADRYSLSAVIVENEARDTRLDRGSERHEAPSSQLLRYLRQAERASAGTIAWGCSRMGWSGACTGSITAARRTDSCSSACRSCLARCPAPATCGTGCACSCCCSTPAPSRHLGRAAPHSWPRRWNTGTATNSGSRPRCRKPFSTPCFPHSPMQLPERTRSPGPTTRLGAIWCATPPCACSIACCSCSMPRTETCCRPAMPGMTNTASAACGDRRRRSPTIAARCPTHGRAGGINCAICSAPSAAATPRLGCRPIMAACSTTP